MKRTQTLGLIPDLIEAVLEVPTEYLVFGIGGRIGPDRSEAPYQSGNPIRCLERLIAVAFQMERRLDKMPPRLLARIHTLRGLGDQLRSLIMFIENQDEILRRLAVTFAEFVNPFDGLAKDRPVESVRVMDTWRLGLPDPDGSRMREARICVGRTRCRNHAPARRAGRSPRDRTPDCRCVWGLADSRRDRCGRIRRGRRSRSQTGLQGTRKPVPEHGPRKEGKPKRTCVSKVTIPA